MMIRLSTENHDIDWGSVAQYLAAAGSVFASFVAIWGNQWRYRLFPPRAILSLIDSKGVDIVGHEEDRKGLVRWYHLKVENLRRWVPVTGVRVFLLKIEVLSDSSIVPWEGVLPLTWRHESNLNDGHNRHLGHSAEADLFAIRLGERLQICTTFDGAYTVGTSHKGPVHLRLHIQARGLEADSNILIVDVNWDGRWPKDRELVPKHVQVQTRRARG